MQVFSSAPPAILRAGSFSLDLSAATQDLALFQMEKEGAQLARKSFLDASYVLSLRNPLRRGALPAKLP